MKSTLSTFGILAAPMLFASLVLAAQAADLQPEEEWVAAQVEHGDRRALDAFTVGAATTLKKVEIWKLKPTSEGFREAQKNLAWLPDEGKGKSAR